MDYNKVFMAKWNPFSNMLKKAKKLYEEAEIFDVVEKGDLVAIKLHVGELGNPNYIRPFFVKQILDEVIKRGGKPFLTDTTTYYPEMRANGYDHHENAVANGFGFGHFIGADGLKGGYVVPVPTGSDLIKEIEVAGALYEADAMIVVTHVKGHPLVGIGGAIKNLGMGGVSKKSKLAQHRLVDMELNTEKCQGCGACREACRMQIPVIDPEKNVVVIDDPRCMRCPLCSQACPEGVITLIGKERLCRGVALAANTVLKTFKPNKVAFVSFAVSLSTVCDCGPMQAEMIGPDVGIFAGFSALSVDAASFSSIDHKRLNELHKTDAWEQIRCLKELGYPGSDTPEIVTI
jgi:uncharacterized Fe-S center protein